MRTESEQVTTELPGLARAGEAGLRSPVFVDESGRRRKWVRRAGVLGGGLIAVYIAALAISLAAGPAGPRSAIPFADGPDQPKAGGVRPAAVAPKGEQRRPALPRDRATAGSVAGLAPAAPAVNAGGAPPRGPAASVRPPGNAGAVEAEPSPAASQVKRLTPGKVKQAARTGPPGKVRRDQPVDPVSPSR
jgi:hypothetical protein